MRDMGNMPWEFTPKSLQNSVSHMTFCVTICLSYGALVHVSAVMCFWADRPTPEPTPTANAKSCRTGATAQGCAGQRVRGRRKQETQRRSKRPRHGGVKPVASGAAALSRLHPLPSSRMPRESLGVASSPVLIDVRAHARDTGFKTDAEITRMRQAHVTTQPLEGSHRPLGTQTTKQERSLSARPHPKRRGARLLALLRRRLPSPRPAPPTSFRAP